MTNDELADFLGVARGDPLRAKVARLPAEKRAAYEAMAAKIAEVQLYDAGLGPPPAGVIVCRPRRKR